MKILVLASCFPYPPEDGVRIKLYYLIKGLAERGHKIHLLSLTATEYHSHELAKYCETINTVELVRRSTITNVLANLLSKHVLYSSHKSETFATRLNRITKHSDIEMIHFDTINLAQYIEAVENRLPSVLSINDSHSLSIRDIIFVKKEMPLIEKAYYAGQLPIATSYERNYYEKFQKIHVVSSVDKWYLKSLNPKMDVQVIPNGIDTNFYHPSEETSSSKGFLLVYVAGLRAHHHEIAWFMRRVLPYVSKKMRNVTLCLVGRDLPEYLVHESRKKNNVHITGYVTDIRPFLDKGHVFIDPLFKRGGIPNHVLQAMAMGKPVVGTKFSFLAIEGARSWKNVVIANDANDFASKIIHLLKNEDERKVIGTNARQLIESRYTWAKIIPRYEEMYNQAIVKFESQ